MITRFITNVSVSFNPFSPRARSAKLFLSLLPPKARANGMIVKTELFPRASLETSSLHVKFKDGKEIHPDCENLGIKSVIEEVDRHSRQLQKQVDLYE